MIIAHSPDADDAFMFQPLFQGKVDTEGLSFEEVLEDIDALNRKAVIGTYDVTAVSFHAYSVFSETYLLLTTGACFGEKYGPIVVSAKPLKLKQLLKVRMAIPGKSTTAFLVLKLLEHSLAGEGKSGVCYSEVSFDKVLDAVAQGKADAGLVIHEGQLNYEEKGLHKIIDLGEWWHKETGLPLPLGAIAIRRDLDPDMQKKVARVIRSSIQYALDHKEEVLPGVIPLARGLDAERTAKFVGMYVNQLTVDFGRQGLKAIRTLFEKGYQSGAMTREINIDDCIFDSKKKSPMVESEEVVSPSGEISLDH